MPHDGSSFPAKANDTALEEAARLLRGLRERVADLESGEDPPEDVGLLRTASDTAVSSDTVTVIEDTGPGSVWGNDNWGYSEWNSSTNTLTVSSGETYTVSGGDTEKYVFADIDGTLKVSGTIQLTG